MLTIWLPPRTRGPGSPPRFTCPPTLPRHSGEPTPPLPSHKAPPGREPRSAPAARQLPQASNAANETISGVPARTKHSTPQGSQRTQCRHQLPSCGQEGVTHARGPPGPQAPEGRDPASCTGAGQQGGPGVAVTRSGSTEQRGELALPMSPRSFPRAQGRWREDLEGTESFSVATSQKDRHTERPAGSPPPPPHPHGTAGHPWSPHSPLPTGGRTAGV